MKTLRWTSAILAAACLLPNLAAAQGWGPGWLADRSRREGPGFRVGNLELHPGVGAEAGYDTNIFLDDGEDGDDVIGSTIFRISPHIDISTLGRERSTEGEGQSDDQAAPKVRFRAGASAEVYVFLEDQARNNVALNGDLDLELFPAGRFGARFFNHYTRRIRPFTENAPNENNFAVNRNDGGFELTGRTRGGAVQTSVGYAIGLQYFEGDSFRFANSLTHRISANVHYRFLPNTSVFWEGGGDFTDYRDDTPEVLNLSNNWRVHSRVGLNGVITPKLSATVAMGYTGFFLDDPTLNEDETITALASLRLRLTPTTQLGFGYERDAMVTLIGNFRTRDRGFLNFQWLLGRSFLLAFDTSVSRLGFGEVVDEAGMPISVDGSTNRDDLMLNLQLFGEYRFTDWLALSLTLGYTGNFTDFEFAVPSSGGSTIPDPAGFNKFEAWLGLRVFY